MVFIKTEFPSFHHFVHGQMTFHSGIAGVPALRNDFQDSDFMRTHYHSQFDNEDTYNAEAFKFHLNLYGLLIHALRSNSSCSTRLHNSFDSNERKH